MTYTTKAHSRKHNFFCFLPLLYIGILSLLSWKLCPVGESFHTEQVYPMECTWSNSLDTSTTQNLPFHFPCNDSGTATISTILPKPEASYINALGFRISQNFVRIWIDDILVYSQPTLFNRSPFFGKAPGSYWIILHLPDNFADKELRMELTSPYPSYQGYLNPVYLGNKTSLMYYIAETYGYRFLFGCLLLLIGFTLLIFYCGYFSKNTQNRQTFYLGVFGILTGFWFIGESHMIQFFSSHILFFYFITMTTLHLLPQPLLKMIEELPGFPFQRICRTARCLMLFYFWLVIILQALQIRDFMEMLPISMVLLIFLCVLFMVLIYWDFLHNKNRKILSITIALTILCIFSCFELLRGLINLQTRLGTYFQIGVLTFYLVITFFSIQHAISIYTESLRSSYYKELSYKDQMTGCLNRRAFTEHKEDWTPGKQDVVLIADLNNLKYVNDYLGHHAGDSYIISCAEAMLKVFQHKGNCYRIGGDEFLFCGTHLSQKQIEALKKQFTALVMKKCAAISPVCCVAVGIAIASPEDSSFEDIVKRADVQMYENKRILKKTAFP